MRVSQRTVGGDYPHSGTGTAAHMEDSKKERAAGDEVTWRSHGSTAEGRVETKATARRREAARIVAASPEEPQYAVRSENSGKDCRPQAFGAAQGRVSE